MEQEVTVNNRNRTTPDAPVKEINLKLLFNVIKRRLWVVILCTLICAIAGGLYSTRSEVPVYSATSRIIMFADKPEMLGTLKVLMKEPVVLSEVIEQLSLPRSTGFLRSQVSISNVDGSLITLVTVVDADPELAVDIVNTLVDVSSRQLPLVFPSSGIRVLTEAEFSSNPSPINPPSNRAFVVSIFVGIAMGIGAVFLLDSLDDSIRSRRDVERQLEMVLLGQVPRFKKKDLSSKVKLNLNKDIQKRGESIGS